MKQNSYTVAFEFKIIDLEIMGTSSPLLPPDSPGSVARFRCPAELIVDGGG